MYMEKSEVGGRCNKFICDKCTCRKYFKIILKYEIKKGII